VIRDHVDPIGEGTLTTRSRKTLPPVRISGKYSPLVPAQSEEPLGKNGPLNQDPTRIKGRAPQAVPEGIAGATTDPADPSGTEIHISDWVWHAGWERASVRFCTPPGLLRTVQVQAARALQAGPTFYKGLRSIAVQGRAGGCPKITGQPTTIKCSAMVSFFQGNPASSARSGTTLAFLPASGPMFPPRRRAKHESRHR
jgi:hypothetical protein